MSDFSLDTANHDIFLVDGDLAWLDSDVEAENKEEIKQRVLVTLKAFKGEWLFDTEFGVPYREEILVRDPDLNQIDARLRDIISNVEGITQILELSLILDAVTRILTVTMTLDTVEGRLDSFDIDFTV